jgi:hypothetical protein
VSLILGFYNPRASPLQTNPGKSKQNQTNLLVFAWIWLVESGLFKGLHAKKTKKFPSLQLARRVAVGASFNVTLLLFRGWRSGKRRQILPARNDSAIF